MYAVGDIVNFHGDFYEVEKTKLEDGLVVLSASERFSFHVEIEYLRLVCKAADRLDLATNDDH